MLSTVNPTMPRALLVSEILSNIIDYINVNVDERAALQRKARYVTPSGPTLFALALTCRAFSEHALDALWHTLIGLEPLMRCAGIILARGQRLRKQDYPIIPTEAQLAIIGRYSYRVRFFKPYSVWSRPVESFLQTLAYSSKVLMSNLRDLRVTSYYSAHLLRPLLGLRLRRMRIEVSASVYDELDLDFWQRISLHMILRSLPTTCPSLESFEFNVKSSSRPSPWDVPLALPVSYAIQKMPKLRAVTVPAITKDALTYLGGLSSFTSIKTRLPTSRDLEDILDPSRGPLLFENLNTVDWEIAEWRDVEVFTRLWPHKLTSMSLRSEVKFDPSLLQVLFDSLHTREAFRNLQCIRLSEPYHRQFSSSNVITIDTIRPLFYLSHLRVVDIETISCLDIGKVDLEEMGEAWPCLEVLLLKTYGSMSGAARPSLSEVARFVKRYPCLKELCIGITINYVDHDYDMEEESLHALEPRDSDSRLESLVMKYPSDENDIWETYWFRLGILFTKLFPQLKPGSIHLRSDRF
ncbi:hypothetical protein EV702DRAFT_1192857 [Suillus placidus]|uniref:F-box domain-containing protein n=1 Tax=Suillus placidus TaxID=48579 RepID=A0A9P7D894_9AGAM|nr:hypothetical protein EV702DRAFT_1192857 [Suillus placidus]